MKKLIISICLIFFCLGTTIQAQNSSGDPREGSTFGIKAGFNVSNVWDEQGQDFHADAKLGFAGGIFLGLPISRHIGFQPELLISQKGFQGSGTLLLTPYSFSKTTTFIDLPLQIQVKPTEFITILGGPQFSYLVHEKNVYTFGANSSDQEREFSNDNIRKNILGLVFGADAHYSNLVVSGRLGWDLLTNHGDGSSSTPRYKNQWFQMTVGFKI